MPDLIAECLRLRAWVIPLLTRSCTPDELLANWPDPTSRAWTFFLTAEVIAWPLTSRLGPAISALPSDARAILDNAARTELQRIMDARAQLEIIDRVAGLCGIRPVLLKGGVALTDGSGGFDLGDIDLLLDPREHDRLAAALVDHGYVLDTSGEHYAMPGRVPIELHTELHEGESVELIAGSESVCLPGFKCLRQLTPMSHVLYMTQHSTTAHLERRGHLRDVLLIGSALASLSDEERTGMQRIIESSSRADVYDATLAFASATRPAGATPAPRTDVFRRSAAAKYAVWYWFPNGSPAWLPPFLVHVPHLAASPKDARAKVVAYINGPVKAASPWYSPLVARASEPVARAVALAVRTPARILSLTAAALVTGYIRMSYGRDTM